MKPYRPWGLLPWVLSHHPIAKDWGLLGCLGTEHRSLAAWLELTRNHLLSSYRLLYITDAPSRHTPLWNTRIQDREKEFIAAGGNASHVSQHSLSEEQWRIIDALDSFLGTGIQNVVLDITSMPKRFFFPILRQLIRRPSAQLRNLLVTYAVPETYTQDTLAEMFEDWSQLPLFAGRYESKDVEHLIIAVGFEPLGLIDRVETSEFGRTLKFLLPFPAPNAAVRRSWSLLRRLQEHQPPQTVGVHRVDVKDASDSFDRLVSLTNAGRQRADLAPFGPKPISMGMCLFASLTDSRVFYTQPTVYHPDYSIGTSMVDGSPEIYAYCVRLDGNDLYQLPS